MPTESDLRDLFRGPDGSGPGIDAGQIIRRARRRRTPRVVATGAGALLVIAAVVVPVAGIGLARGGIASTAGSAPDTSGRAIGGSEGRTDGMKEPAARPQAACAGPTPAPTTAAIDVSLDTVDAAVGAPVSGVLVLTATGATGIRITGPVALTVQSADGTVAWSGTTDLGSPMLSLAGGDGARLPFTVRVVDCASGSVLPAGDYRIAANVPVSVDGDPAIRIGGDGGLRIG